VSNLSDRERTIRQRLKDDFPHYAPRCLKIRTKEGGLEPFVLNAAQLALHERLERQLAETGKVRALVLKGRQTGISTYIQGRFYHKVTHSKGRRAFILTHQKQATKNLFNMTNRFHDNCPAMVRPNAGASNVNELYFDGLDSGYAVATAGAQDVGRSDTVQLFHGSEVAFWPNAESHMEGIGQTIPDAPATERIMESTAKGIGNLFYALWRAAERGDSDDQAIFLPWFIHEEYAEEPPPDWHPPEAFLKYEQGYNLSRAQTYWAWKKNRELANTISAPSDRICWKFKQEYPANATEAFQMSGDSPFIPADAIVAARAATVEAYGPIILGVDPARGGGDKTGFMDRQLRRLGMHCCEHFDSRDLMRVTAKVIEKIKELKPLGLKKVAIDVTGLGAGVYDRLVELGYGDLIEPVNFAETAYETEKYMNRRAEIWDLQRQWFDDKASVQVNDSDDLHADLSCFSWTEGGTGYQTNGKLKLESKEHMRKRLGFSPDLGDAGALTFAVDMNELMEPVDDEWRPAPLGEGGYLAS